MLHIIGMILKILGILILVILGLLLLIFLTVLLVPIRYEASLEKQEKILAKGEISWLFSLIKLEFLYSENGMETKFKFFKKRKTKDKPIKEEFIREYDEEELTALEKEINEEAKQIEPQIESESKSAEQVVEEIDEYEDCSQEYEDDEEEIVQKEPSHLKEQLLEIYEFLKKPSVRKTIQKIFSRLKKTIKKVLPRKLNANIHFGFGDPAITGQVLAIASMFYAWYCGCINLEPDFESEEIVIDGNIDMKGKIRFIYFLSFIIKTAINIWFDKEIKTFIMKKLRR